MELSLKVNQEMTVQIHEKGTLDSLLVILAPLLFLNPLESSSGDHQGDQRACSLPGPSLYTWSVVPAFEVWQLTFILVFVYKQGCMSYPFLAI
jgi:hypothetical protein